MGKLTEFAKKHNLNEEALEYIVKNFPRPEFIEEKALKFNKDDTVEIIKQKVLKYNKDIAYVLLLPKDEILKAEIIKTIYTLHDIWFLSKNFRMYHEIHNEETQLWFQANFSKEVFDQLASEISTESLLKELNKNAVDSVKSAIALKTMIPPGVAGIIADYVKFLDDEDILNFTDVSNKKSIDPLGDKHLPTLRAHSFFVKGVTESKEKDILKGTDNREEQILKQRRINMFEEKDIQKSKRELSVIESVAKSIKKVFGY